MLQINTINDLSIMDTTPEKDQYELTVYKIASNRTESESYWFDTLDAAKSFKSEIEEMAKGDDCPYRMMVTIEKNIKKIIDN
jgi:hypothetical protein